MRNAERVRDEAHILVLALEGEARRSGCNLEFGDLRQHVQERLSQAVGEILVVLVAGHIDERQHGDRCHIGNRCRLLHLHWIGAKARPGNKSNSGDDGRYGDVIKLACRMRCDRPVRRDVFFFLQAFGRQLIDPGEDDGRHETQRDDGNDDFRNPLGRAENRHQGSDDLGQQPADHQVGGCNPEHVAASKLGKERHVWAPYPNTGPKPTLMRRTNHANYGIVNR